MTREDFKFAYMAEFLGAFAAWKNRSQPVEDAEELANEAWDQFQANIGTDFASLKGVN